MTWILLVPVLVLLALCMCRYRDPSTVLSGSRALLDSNHSVRPERTIHRLLLWDESFPVKVRPLVWKVHRGTHGFVQYLWRAADVEELLRRYPAYATVYFGYRTRIQKADFARYLIVYHCGGGYLDHDVSTTQRKLAVLLDGYRQSDCVLFEELTWVDGQGAFTRDYRIRQELPAGERQEAALRVANYVFFARAGAVALRCMLDKCVQRADYEVLEPYDILFTTGPDVVSTVVAELQGDAAPVVVPKTETDRCLRHLAVHGWYPEVVVHANRHRPR